MKRQKQIAVSLPLEKLEELKNQALKENRSLSNFISTKILKEASKEVTALTCKNPNPSL